MRKKKWRQMGDAAWRTQHEHDSGSSSSGSSNDDHSTSSSSSEEEEADPCGGSFNPLRWESQTIDLRNGHSSLNENEDSRGFVGHKDKEQVQFWNNPRFRAPAVDTDHEPDGKPQSHDEPEVPTEKELNRMTVALLKEQLKERGLKVGGKKAELIARLLEDYDAASTGSKEFNRKTKAELKQLLLQKGLNVGGNKSEMIDRLMGREIVNKKPGKWKNSEARALLWKLLLDKKSYVHGLSAEDVHTSHEWFEAFPFDKFNKYLTDMQASAANHRKIVEEDNRLVNLEYSLIPIKNMSSRGYPIWRNHPASVLLREEIEREGALDGKRVTLTPLERQKTNSEYKAFPAKVFSQHICQERRRV